MPASFVEERRKAALEAYEAEAVPTWRRSGFWTTSLRGLDLDALEPKRYEEGLPELDLGDEQHSALIVQRGASVVHTDVADERIIVMPLEQAVVEHEELVREYFAKRLPHDEGKFAAGTAAFWTGGVFVHVPANVQIEHPIQIAWLIDEPGTAQWAHTLVVVGEHAEVKIREFFEAPDFEGQALHSGAFELYALPGRPGRPRPLPGLGPRRGLRPVHAPGRDPARRAREVGADPPRRPADQADARHHHRRGGLGHAPHRPLLHRARRAPRPVHHATGTRPATPPATRSGRAC